MKPYLRPEPPITGLEDINYRISSFINTFTTILYVALAMAVGGVIMKFLQINGGSYVFIFSIIILTLIFLVQIGLSFFFIVSHVKLALLGAFGSLALGLGFLAILFRYQGWLGWQIMYFIALPIFLITAFFLGKYRSRHEKLHHNQLRFLNRNLLYPYVLAFILGIASFVIDFRDREPNRNIILENAPPETIDSIR
ncbi:hypothetical protein [Adhaeribacter terreus]|uniref:Uncharacterized protein n=1 Tax=Adhaeribacter terreus TaxID=529703 RepID=A0ABW0EA98_9BACT